MCRNFWALNKIFFKEKFPILVIDYPLDDLKGSQFFTKIDLYSGYHQTHMKEVDIPKIIFYTHEGHYELLVMPLGLCNAPSTFYSIMNYIFQPSLHHFVCVFFDYILTYSKTQHSHVTHVH